MEDDAVGTPVPQFNKGPSIPAGARLSQVAGAAGEIWKQAKPGEKMAKARQQTEVFVRENPVPIIVGALAVGLAIGWALRQATREEEEVGFKNPLGGVDWRFLSLPFLWPIFKSVREKAEDSAETIKGVAREGVDRVRNIDIDRYAKPLRKRWKSWTD